MAPQWWLLVVVAIFLSMGAGTIDTVLNTYMARHYDARVINWLHAFYGVGATLGPLIFTLAITLDQNWQVGYRTVGIILGLQTICFLSTLHWWNHSQNPTHLTSAEPTLVVAASYWETLNNASVWLGIGLFFLYTGLEVTVGQWTFSLLTEARAIPPDKAGFWVSAYWGSLTVGRFVFGYVARHFSINRLIRLSMVVVLAGAALYGLRNSAWASLSGLMLVGFFLAPIFPSLISATAERLGEKFAANAIGFQISAATLGAACIPSLGGVLANRYGLETISWYVVLLTILMLGIHEWQLKNTGNRRQSRFKRERN
jgi:fucose permease